MQLVKLTLLNCRRETAEGYTEGKDLEKLQGGNSIHLGNHSFQLGRHLIDEQMGSIGTVQPVWSRLPANQSIKESKKVIPHITGDEDRTRDLLRVKQTL